MISLFDDFLLWWVFLLSVGLFYGDIGDGLLIGVWFLLLLCGWLLGFIIELWIVGWIFFYFECLVLLMLINLCCRLLIWLIVVW